MVILLCNEHEDNLASNSVFTKHNYCNIIDMSHSSILVFSAILHVFVVIAQTNGDGMMVKEMAVVDFGINVLNVSSGAKWVMYR